MNDQTSFADILDRPVESAERPKSLPIGTYHTILKGAPKHGESSKKKTPQVEFVHRFVAAMSDVDEEALDAALTSADGTKRLLTDIEMKNTYYKTDNALWRLREFLEDCGLDVEGRKFNEVLDETPNAEVGVTIRHEASDDGKNVFAKIGGTVKLD